jgi:hypothetical protein
MISNVVVMMVPVEIGQDEETAEAEPSPPEWRWHPIIEIAVFRRRWIISHDRRLVIVIVILNDKWLQVFRSLLRRGRGA